MVMYSFLPLHSVNSLKFSKFYVKNYTFAEPKVMVYIFGKCLWQIPILALVVPHIKLLLKCTFIWSSTIKLSAPESCNFVKNAV